jgi:hypothetical protein
VLPFLRCFSPACPTIVISYCSTNIFLNLLVSNYAMFRGCHAMGERNGNLITIDVPAFGAVLIQD